MTITLFPDQQEALDLVLAHYQDCPIGGKALIVAPTAWGKTIFFSSLIHALKGRSILVLAHRDELLNQAIRKIHLIDPTAIVGKVGGGVHHYGAPITVASIDTISGPKHLKQLHHFKYDLIICDECHHGPAPKYLKIFDLLPHAFRVGVTATPTRLDGQSLAPLFGPPLFEMSILEAIQKNRLSNIGAIAIGTETDLDQVASRKNKDGEIDFDETQLDLVINTPERNRRIVEGYQQHCSGMSFIVFCISIAHAEAVAYAFADMGIPTKCINGSTPPDARESIYQAVEHGAITGMSNVLVLTEGFDLPRIKCVILARPTQSESLYKQMIGRGMRLFENQDCIILDITDNTLKYRLQRQNLRRATHINIQDGETLLDAAEREQEEQKKRDQEEGEAQLRRLKERRPKDVYVDLLTVISWEELDTGGWRAIVGKDLHRVAILPSKDNPALFYVAARLAPNLTTTQKWSSDCTLEEAQQIAERKILAIHQGHTNWVDKTNPRRQEAITNNQKKMLNWFKIPYGEGTPILTFGDASDAIDEHQLKIEQKKKAKAARQAEKEQQELANTPGVLGGNREFSLMKKAR